MKNTELLHFTFKLSMQARFHGVFSPEESRHRPVFHRPPAEYDPETNLPIQATFLQNSYAMVRSTRLLI